MYRELPFARDGAVVWTRMGPTYATTPSDPAGMRRAKVRRLRMRRLPTVALARTGVAFAAVAATAGYAEQAHLCREVRELAGVPLRDLVA
jgi:hypothetical protein